MDVARTMIRRRADDPWNWENHNCWRRAAFLTACAILFVLMAPVVLIGRLCRFDPEGRRGAE